MRLLFAMLALFLATLVSAQAQEDEAAYLAALDAALPGTLMNNPLDASWLVYGEGAASKIVQSPEIPGQRAFQVRVRDAAPNPWDISAHGPVVSGVEAGDGVFIAFWARAAKVDRAARTGEVQVRLQQKAAPYAGVVEGTVRLAAHWQVHYLSDVSAVTLGAGEIDISFNIGALEQTVEFGQYYVTNVGKGADLASLPSGSEDPK